MKLLKNRVFAIFLTAVVVVGCCAYGFLAKPNQTAADQTHLEYGKSNYSSYLDWIADEADLLSDETEKTVATYMAAMDHGWGSIVTVVTEDSGGADLQTRAKDWAAKGNLGGRDMVLLLDAGSGHWYMQPGQDIKRYVDQKLTSTVTACFDGRSVTKDADKILTELFPDLYSWYEHNLTASKDSGASPVLFSFGVVALLILVIAIASAASIGRGGRGGGGGTRYRRGGTNVFWGPTIFFPGRFGGFGPRYPHHRPPHHDHDRNDHRDDWPFGGSGGFGGGFGSGGFGGGDRGGGFGGGGGGFGGGGFGGGDRGGGFGG